MHKDITSYNNSQSKSAKAVCSRLEKEIKAGLPKAESKIWHGAPVWFIDGNPIVGYFVRKEDTQLLFWSGQSFEEEPKLIPTGKFKSSEARYTDVDQINSKDLIRWLKKSQSIQWDYKNIVKRRGKLIRLS